MCIFFKLAPDDTVCFSQCAMTVLLEEMPHKSSSKFSARKMSFLLTNVYASFYPAVADYFSKDAHKNISYATCSSATHPGPPTQEVVYYLDLGRSSDCSDQEDLVKVMLCQFWA